MPPGAEMGARVVVTPDKEAARENNREAAAARGARDGMGINPNFSSINLGFDFSLIHQHGLGTNYQL